VYAAHSNHALAKTIVVNINPFACSNTIYNVKFTLKQHRKSDMSILQVVGEAFLHLWHGMMSLQSQSPPSWYEDRLREEVVALSLATGYIEKLSEESDLFFLLSRSQYDGFPQRVLPPLLHPWFPLLTFRFRNALVYAYMILKYTGRFAFYRAVARRCGDENWWDVREVIDPADDSNLEEVAKQHGIEEERFKKVAKRLLRWWPLLP
jgi:hypothetical protein